MLPAAASAPIPEPPSKVLAAYREHLTCRGRGNVAFDTAARSFLRRWQQPQDWADLPLGRQLAAGPSLRPFLTFLMLTGRLAPGYDYLVRRKLSSLWNAVAGTPMADELELFLAAATRVGFSQRVARGMGSQVAARLLIQTGTGLDEITVADLDALEHACRTRQARDGVTCRHYLAAIHATRDVLFHEGIVDSLTPPALVPATFEQRMAAVAEPLRPAFVAYLHRKSVTCVPKTVSSLATRLSHFGAFLAATDPTLDSLRGLDRRRHVEPFLVATRHARAADRTAIGVADQARRIHAAANFLSEITEWGWPDAPERRLFFPSDMPRQPRPLPRYLPPDADRALTEALVASTNRMPADALLLARATGMRIGELLDLETCCVHDTADHGSWLKVPLGKLDTERMVPIDEEALALLDRITRTRSPGRPMTHPRTGRPADFLLTHHGRRLSASALRKELSRGAETAGIGHVTPHQLRHTYATSMVNAGVSLQALMALLGHSSAQMTLRYAHLFDHTVRTEYERALDQARTRIGVLPTPQPPASPDGQPWTELPLVGTALGVGHCMRAPAQGPCPHANICLHCPSLHVDHSDVPALQGQRDETTRLIGTAGRLGWTSEVDRHRKLLERLDALLATADTA